MDQDYLESRLLRTISARITYNIGIPVAIEIIVLGLKQEAEFLKNLRETRFELFVGCFRQSQAGWEGGRKIEKRGR